MSEADELDQRVKEITQELNDALADVSTWSVSKRADAEATMYAPSLSSMYESVLKPNR
jgi:hypothetical protein